MSMDAAMRQQSYFPAQENSFDSMPEYEELKKMDELDYTEFYDRVNS